MLNSSSTRSNCKVSESRVQPLRLWLPAGWRQSVTPASGQPMVATWHPAAEPSRAEPSGQENSWLLSDNFSRPPSLFLNTFFRQPDVESWRFPTGDKVEICPYRCRAEPRAEPSRAAETPHTAERRSQLCRRRVPALHCTAPQRTAPHSRPVDTTVPSARNSQAARGPSTPRSACTSKE